MSTARAPQQRTTTKESGVLDAVIQATEEITVYGTQEKITLTLEEVRLLIAIPTKSGKLPSDREILLFMKVCKARGFNPYSKEVFLIGYDTKDGAKFETVVGLPAMLKRCEGNQDYAGKEYGVLVWDAAAKQVVHVVGDCVPKDLAVVGGWCRIHREGKLPEYATATMKAYNKGFGHWSTDPNWMIAKCAIAKACRQAFPSDVGDLMIAEEAGPRVERQEQRQRTSGPPVASSGLSERLAQLAEQTQAVQAAATATDDQEVHGDAWEPDEEERASIEGQLFETHPNAAEE